MIKHNPLVSIIIPVYNGSNYIREAIDSAISQTYKNIEIIVVNDGSTDGGKTDKVAKSYGNKIRYYKKKNGKVASALNFGINKMKGEYFSWLSHDDMYYPNKIAEQIKYLTRKNQSNIVVYSNYDLIDENSKVFRQMKLVPKDPSDIKYYLLTQSVINGCTLLIPKICFDEYGLFDTTLITTQDYDYWLRIVDSYHFMLLPKTLVKSRQHHNQDSVLLRSTANKDIDTLTQKWLSTLSVSVLTKSSGISPYKSYSYLFSNFHNRGLYGARNIVIWKFIKYLLHI